MSTFLVVSIMADDRPGLVETLSRIVTEYNGNWLDSRMARMAGKFAGIIHIQSSTEQAEGLTHALESLNQKNWKIVVEACNHIAEDTKTADFTLSIVANDRPGIVKDVSQALAAKAINVLDFHTHCESAAMSAELLFKTKAHIQIPEDVDADELKETLEDISNDMMVDIQRR